MTRKSRLLSCCTLALALLPSASRGADDENKPAPPRLQCWVDLYRGEPLSYQAVVDDLAGVGVVYLGERHGLARHHKIQEQIITDLAARGVPLVLGLEQMEAVYQRHLDRYSRGEIDFDELAEATEWKRRWAEYESYRGALEAARTAKAPILALNARRETIRKVARGGGVDRLDAASRKELPEDLHLDDTTYEQLLRLRLPVHATVGPDRLRPMIEAQIARDEKMASVLATFLQSDEGKGRTAVVLCGAMHCAYGLGTADRVRRRIPGVKDRIILMSDSGDSKLSPAMQAMSRPITVTHEQLRQLGRPIADYLHITSRKVPGPMSPASNP